MFRFSPATSFQQRSWQLLLAIAISTIVIVVSTLVVVYANKRTTVKIDTAANNIQQLAALETAAIKAEASERTYCLLNDTNFLQTFKEAHQTLITLSDSALLTAYLLEYPQQATTLLQQIRQQELHMNMAIDKHQHLDTATILHKNDAIDSIRSIIKYISQQEHSNIQAAKDAQQRNTTISFWLIIVCIVVNVLLLYQYYKMVQHNIVEHQQIENALIKAKNQAEEANESKARFLSTVSHEIRTPMNAMLGMATLLKQTPLNDEQRRYLINIQRSGVALLVLVNDIVDFSKMEAGKLKIEHRPFVVHHVIDEVFSIVKSTNANVIVDYQIARDVPRVLVGDANRLRQLLINLLYQSLQHIQKGYVELTITAQQQSNKQWQLNFTVLAENNDTNVLLDEMPLDISDAADFGSKLTVSGFGLSIATRLATLLGGKVKLETNNNHTNYTFTLSLPEPHGLTPEEIAQLNKHDSQFEDINPKLADEIPLSILIVDDQEMNLVLLSSILVKMGYVFATAHNGAEAVQMATQNKYQLIFMDIYMPVMDGVEATQRIRKHYLPNEQPIIIALTANAVMENKAYAQEKQLNDVLIKPYKPADIENIIRQWLAPQA
jgi:signal transduction histidine kinase/ActR/RegA family two-component response regulator